MKAQHLQYEARVMAEATKTMENTAFGLQRQAKEEQQQLKEANFAVADPTKCGKEKI